VRQALVNANPDLAGANSKYVMRITGDNDERKAQLDNFIDPESTFPVIAPTSQLMSTGVDAQICHLLALDKRIRSMTEFKQIIGRGTRINEDYNKFFFTIMDSKRATALFADPPFDGDPAGSTSRNPTSRLRLQTRVGWWTRKKTADGDVVYEPKCLNRRRCESARSGTTSTMWRWRSSARGCSTSTPPANSSRSR
jgi:hypothetical protein